MIQAGRMKLHKLHAKIGRFDRETQAGDATAQHQKISSCPMNPTFKSVFTNMDCSYIFISLFCKRKMN